MRRITAVIAVAVASAALLAACGSDGNGGGGSGSAGTYGTGLELGRVLRTSPVGRVDGPWYRWNNDTCSFQTTDEHPATYRADVREITGGDRKLGYMHYGNSDTFGVANSKSVDEVSKLAGYDLDVYNLKFPSRTEPLSSAKLAIVKQDRGVLQANLDPSILPAFYKILEGQGCIPSIQLYIPVPGHPSMGASWPQAGEQVGAYVAEQAKQRGWKPADTALVQCTDPDNGPSVNIMFDSVAEQVEQDGFAIPAANQFKLVCKLTESQSGEKRVTDWFTGHPDFKHVAITSIDSPRMQSIIKAVQREGIADEDRILADTGLDPADQKSVRAGEQDVSVAFFPERYGNWLIPMIEDAMAGNPIPKVLGTKLVPGTQDNVDDLYPQG